MHPALRLVMSTLMVSGLVLWSREFLAAALLSPAAWIIDWMDPHHVIASLGIERAGADTIIRMEAGIRRMVVMGEHVTFADPRARAVITTPVMAFMIGPTCALVFAIAWPAKRWLEYPARVALALAFCLAMIAIDVPLVLDAHLWELHRDAHAPDATMPIILWRDFLKNGGRIVLGVSVGMLCVNLVRRRFAPVSTPAGAAPAR
jgi:hypothetical protein